jgi:putative transposase
MQAIKLELKLNNKERSKLKGCAGFRRVVYNFGLDMVKGMWSSSVKSTDTKSIALAKKLLTSSVSKSEEYEWMKEYPSTVYQSAFNDLKTAFSRYRKGITKCPVYSSKKKGLSFTVYKSSGTYIEKGKPALAFSQRQTLPAGNKIKIPGLGTFRLKEKLEFTCASQTFTVSEKAGRWFVSFLLDASKLPPIVHEQDAVGIDLGVKCFATLSDNTTYESPKPYKKARIKLAKKQYRNRNKVLGNKKKGIKASNNAKKFYKSLSKIHFDIANKRKDFLNKTTTEISKKYHKIFIEDLNVSGMIANRKLSSAISDLGFYEFRRQLEYKQNFYATELVIVDRFFPSSKTCSSCGDKKEKLSLSERTFNCNNCGFTIDRDLNASINLVNYKK